MMKFHRSIDSVQPYCQSTFDFHVPSSSRVGVLSLMLAFTFLGTAADAAKPASVADKPNVLFIFADDQCFDTIRSLGNEEIETPNLDRLVQRGTTFTHAYNMGSWSGAVCVASRTMLNSGRYLWRANAIYQQSERERAEGRWWSELMKSAGYRTYMTGKWHCRANAAKAFDMVADVRGGMPKQTEAGYNRPLLDQPDPWSPSDPKFGGFWEGGKHWSEVVGDHAEKFLSDAAQRDNPFFMYVAFNAPHDPRQSPQSFVDRYPTEKLQIPASFQPLYPFKDSIGCGPGLRDEKLAPFPRTEEAVRVHRQEYYAIITHMDEQIGRILDALEASGQSKNTWIFFSADHGLAVGHHGLMGKQNMYDHSVRVPFIVSGPGVAADEKIETPIYLQDLMATTLELAALEKPDYVEFNSVLPLLRGESRPAQPIYGAYLNLQRSVRTEQFKLIAYPKVPCLRLYDVQADPEEMHDLSADPEYRETVQSMFEKLIVLQKKMEDPLDLTTVFPVQ